MCNQKGLKTSQKVLKTLVINNKSFVHFCTFWVREVSIAGIAGFEKHIALNRVRVPRFLRTQGMRAPAHSGYDDFSSRFFEL